MNYVKHLSIALLLVLGSAVQAADTKKVVLKGVSTPGGTALVQAVDKDGKVQDWTVPGNWSHPEIKPGGKRDGQKLTPVIDKDTGLTDLLDTNGKSVFKKDKDGKLVLGGKDGKQIVDANDDKLFWTVNHEDVVVPGTETALKKFIRTNVFEQTSTVKVAMVAVPVLGFIAAYKGSQGFKDAVDNGLTATSDFINDVKDGNGNARRNALIGVAGAVGLGLCVHKAYTDKWSPLGA